jgi:hypothetical protein
MFIVYKTDTWHSHSSHELIGLCTTVASVIAICQQRAAKENSRINKEQIELLKTIRQTQGYSGPGEFLFAEYETDTLL